jgi:hypothetical protein
VVIAAVEIAKACHDKQLKPWLDDRKEDHAIGIVVCNAQDAGWDDPGRLDKIGRRGPRLSPACEEQRISRSNHGQRFGNCSSP